MLEMYKEFRLALRTAHRILSNKFSLSIAGFEVNTEFYMDCFGELKTYQVSMNRQICA